MIKDIIKSKKEYNKILINNQMINYTHSIALSEKQVHLSFFNKIRLIFGCKLNINLILYFNKEKVINTNLIIEVKNDK